MSAEYKPEGYPAVSPYLVINGAQRAIDFLKQAFDATELRRYDNADGTVMHVELRIGESVIMMGDSGGQWPAFPSGFTCM